MSRVITEDDIDWREVVDVLCDWGMLRRGMERREMVTFWEMLRKRFVDALNKGDKVKTCVGDKARVCVGGEGDEKHRCDFVYLSMDCNDVRMAPHWGGYCDWYEVSIGKHGDVPMEEYLKWSDAVDDNAILDVLENTSKKGDVQMMLKIRSYVLSELCGHWDGVSFMEYSFMHIFGGVEGNNEFDFRYRRDKDGAFCVYMRPVFNGESYDVSPYDEHCIFRLKADGGLHNAENA